MLAGWVFPFQSGGGQIKKNEPKKFDSRLKTDAFHQKVKYFF